MKREIRNLPLSKCSIDTTELSITLFLFLSFTVQLFSHVLRSNTLLIAALLMTGLVTIFLNAYTVKTYPFIVFIWLTTFVIVFISILRPSSYTSEFSINKYVDLFVFFAGIMLLIFCGSKSKSFRSSAKIIMFFAVFYALSVWVQIFLPPLYTVFLSFMPETSFRYIVQGSSSGEYFTGFTSNAGYTAGYIACGIIILFTKTGNIVSSRIRRLILILFLSLSLLMTGRRAHTLFLIIALVAVYVFPYRERKFYRRIIVLFACVILFLLCLMLFWDVLMQIPFFARIGLSINSILNGGDIGTGRLPLYTHAWKLFLGDPWFGIGWGNFRYTTIGNITIRTEMEVHNVYLQLLTETGIVGFILVMIPITIMLITTLLNIRRLKEVEKESWYSLLSYSLAYQMFFLLYGLTGNPFFDPSFLMMYFFSCAIPIAFARFRQKQMLLERCNSEFEHQPLTYRNRILSYSPRICERIKK